jgi:hypothetical protein
VWIIASYCIAALSNYKLLHYCRLLSRTVNSPEKKSEFIRGVMGDAVHQAPFLPNRKEKIE